MIPIIAKALNVRPPDNGLYGHTRWGWGPVRGAYAPSGGHVHVFGFHWTWLPRAEYDGQGKWTPVMEFEFLRLFYIRRDPEGTRWAVARFGITFTRASWRLGKREAARARRAAGKRFDKIRRAVHGT